MKILDYRAIVYSLISAFLSFFVTFAISTSHVGQLSAMFEAWTLGIPIGSTIGLVFYRLLKYNFTKVNMLGSLLAMALSFAATLSVRFSVLEVGALLFGKCPKIVLILLFVPYYLLYVFLPLFAYICALLGYEFANKLAIRLKQTKSG